MPDLYRLLHPRHVAVIGGGVWGASVVEQCRNMGFAGPIWPVHPHREILAGVPCYRTVEDLPEPPDAVFIGVNRHVTVEAVGVLSRLGAGGAVCFASGFAEAADDRAAGAALQARLVQAAGDMPVLGPNCYGLINYLDGALLWPDQHGGRRTGRGVAIVGQSSNVLINLTMQRRGVPVAYVVAAGNQAQIGLAEIGMELLDDPRVTALGLHIEGVGSARAFEALAARARALRKPIVALKVGRSDQAHRAAISHTASLVGGDAVGRAFLSRIGIALAETLPGFLQTLMLAHVHGPLPGHQLAALSCSGGEASLVADAAHGRRVHFPALTTQQAAAVKATLSDLVAVANPIDYHTFIWGDVARMTATYAAMMGQGFDLNLLIYDMPRADRCSTAAWHCALEALEAARAATDARVALVATLPETLPEDLADWALARGIAPMAGLEETLAAAEALADLGAAWAQPAPVPVAGLAPVPATQVKVLDEAAAKAWLSGHGLAVPEALAAATPDDAAAAAARLGYAVALKGLGIAHKTEAGAIAVGLSDAASVRRAAARMAPAVSGFLVERMVEGAVAELLVGVARDPVYGLTLTVGAGGILAELFADRALLPMPARPDDIREALQRLAIAPVLGGYRGRPAGDAEAAVGAILTIQEAALAKAGTLLELDVNPLIVTPSSAVAVDALAAFAEP